MRKNIKIRIEYDGTKYSGWQRQSNSPSIQEELEEGLFKLTGEKIILQAAGRTDSGVHARGQIANFFTSSPIPPERFSLALNAVIPYDIRITHSKEVTKEFHSRFCAKARHYRYSMVAGSHGIAIGKDFYYHIPVQLDMTAMGKGLDPIKGTHDFRAFQAAGSQVKTTLRTMYDAKLTRQGQYLYLDLIGNGFLYNMVRIIAGTIIEIGKGKMEYSRVEEILKSGDRRLAGPTAPPHGLCLEEVYYSWEAGRFFS